MKIFIFPTRCLDKSNWTSATKHGAFATRRQPINRAIANITYTGSDHQNNEDAEKIEQCSVAGLFHTYTLSALTTSVKLFLMIFPIHTFHTSKQVELIDILKNMFLPSKKMIKEQLEWLIEHKYMRRDDDDINTFIYMA